MQWLPGGEDLKRRAVAAWFRTEPHAHLNQPSLDLFVGDGRYYVQLHNVNGVLAVYRVTNEGRLKRLRRPPHELREAR